MADNNLNCVRCFEQLSIVKYIDGTKLHMSYACTCAIQAKTSTMVNHMGITWQSRENYVIMYHRNL